MSAHRHATGCAAGLESIEFLARVGLVKVRRESGQRLVFRPQSEAGIGIEVSLGGDVVRQVDVLYTCIASHRRGRRRCMRTYNLRRPRSAKSSKNSRIH